MLDSKGKLDIQQICGVVAISHREGGGGGGGGGGMHKKPLNSKARLVRLQSTSFVVQL